MTVLTPANAFPGIPFPNNLSGRSKPQSFVYSSAVQPKKRSAVDFNPANLITGNGGFYRSDIGVTLSGSDVTAWADQGPFGHNLSVVGASAGDITTLPAEFGGFPGILFKQATNAALQGTGAPSTKYTVFCLMKFMASTFAVFIDMNQLSMTGWVTGGGGFTVQSGSLLGNGGNPVGINLGPAFLAGFVADGSFLNIWLNALVQGAGSAFSATFGSSFSIGSNGQTTAGAMYGFVGYTQKVLSATDWKNLALWSDQVYGTNFIALKPSEAFLGIPFPNHLAGRSRPQSFLYPGAVQPQIQPGPQLMMQALIQM